MQLQSTNSVAISQHTVLYGGAGTQKTRMIPTLTNPVICSTDQGLASIREHNLPFVECSEYRQIGEFREWMATDAAQQFEEVVFDDFTEICEMRLRFELTQTSHGQQAYGKMADEILAFWRFIRDWKHHKVIVIMKEARIQDQNKALIYAPKTPGKALDGQAEYLFGQIYRMESCTDPKTQQSYPVIRCQGNDQCKAKDRSGRLEALEPAHLGNIIQKVMS